MAPDIAPSAPGTIIKRPVQRISTQNKREKKESIPSREEQMDMVRWWRANGSIPWKPEETNGRITIDKDDLDLYFLKKNEHSAANKHEASGRLEYVVLETYAKHGALKGRYDVADGNVLPYDPCDIDDKLIGADSLLMYVDEDNEREGALVAVDATIDRVEQGFKRARGLQRTAYGSIANAYWYDIESEAPGEAIDQPKEGKVPVINTTVYVPGELMERFVDSRTTAEEGDRLLKRMGAIIAHQQSWELELHARLLTKSVTFDRDSSFMKEHVNGMKRKDLLNELMRLTRPSEPALKREVARMLYTALPVAWEAAQSHPVKESRDKLVLEWLESAYQVNKLRG